MYLSSEIGDSLAIASCVLWEGHCFTLLNHVKLQKCLKVGSQKLVLGCTYVPVMHASATKPGDSI